MQSESPTINAFNIAEYTLTAVLHEGRDTIVYQGRDPQNHALVFKIAQRERATTRVIARLRHEHDILKQLQGRKGVVKCLGWLERQGQLGIILEDPGWNSLDRRLACEPKLPVHTVLAIGLSIARALEQVHQAGIMHKDIKPQNILVHPEGKDVQLLDFSIASQLPLEGTQAALPEALEGTLAYVSPEQTGRTARGLDARTDLYSLGITLYEMLAGQRPFLETELLALVHAHLAKEAPALRSSAPEVPEILAEIVSKLMAKDPERRYQTAQGLAEDLAECIQQWEKSQTIQPFVLGRKDYSPKLRLPEILVGRRHEQEKVTEAFAHVAEGDVGLLLIGGPSGIGKTALVRSVYQDMAKAGRGLFLAGKHDQLARATPYGAWSHALGELMRQWLASSSAVVEEWKARLSKALGANARLIADVIPELEWVMGPLNAVAEVGPNEAKNRLNLTWLALVRTLIEAQGPLIVFLDDLQWADSATLNLFELLLTDLERQSLLVMGAYRNNEVDASHGLWKLVQSVRESKAWVSEITVGPLDWISVRQWISVTLGMGEERVSSLARLLWNKTEGNPFFVGQLLLTWHSQKLLFRENTTGVWAWDIQTLNSSPIADTIVVLMANKVKALPEQTQTLLGWAACAGHEFSLQDVEVLSGWPKTDITQALWPALEVGLVVALDGQYREVQAWSKLSGAQWGELGAEYRFLHDRVQQASYERIAEEARANAHLEMSRRLKLRYESHEGTAQELFEIVRHWNLGSTKINRAEERIELVRWNFRAAQVAKKATAYELMARLLDTALELLGADGMTSQAELLVHLLLERAEASYFLRAFDEVEARAQMLLQFPLPPLARLAVQELRLRSYQTQGDFEHGIETGIQILREQGEVLPDTEGEAGVEFANIALELHQWMETHGEQGFEDTRVVTDLERTLQDAAYIQFIVCCGAGTRPFLGSLVVVRRVQAILRQKEITILSPFWIGMFAYAWAAAFGTYQHSARWANASLPMAERVSSPLIGECMTFPSIYSVYQTETNKAGMRYDKVIARSLESGSYTAVSWGIFGAIVFQEGWRSTPISSVLEKIEVFRPLLARAGDALGQASVLACESWCYALRDLEIETIEIGNELFKDGSRDPIRYASNFAIEICRVLEAHAFLVFGRIQQAYERALEAEQFRIFIYGSPTVTDIPLWAALAAAKLIQPNISDNQRAEYIGQIEHGIARFQYFTEGCPENFEHKLRLLEAEYARIQGRYDDAAMKYEQAISLAHNEGFFYIEALAYQYAGEFYLQRQYMHLAAFHLHQACNTYDQWGAHAVARYLKRLHRDTLAQVALQTRASSNTNGLTITTLTTATNIGGEHFDVGTAVRAAQVLASELNTERVVAQLMQLVLENAGAQYVALVLGNESQAHLEATVSIHGQVTTGLQEAVSTTEQIPQSIVHYVLRTADTVLLSQVLKDTRFAQDPYFQKNSVNSVLALALQHQRKIVGVLYIQHQEPDVFTPARVALLRVMASQGAIALENARLYIDIQQASEALKRTNEQLESLVQTRTRELQKALEDVWGEMDLAKKIQTILLPENGTYQGYEIVGVMHPAEQVGGDYYDVFEAGDKLWVLIGDVSGHGVSAGLIMMMVQTAIRTAVRGAIHQRPEVKPSEIIALVNEAVRPNLQRIGREQYMTLTALCFQGEQVIYAGLHLDILVHRANGTQERIPTDGIWLGLEDQIEKLLPNQIFVMHQNDTLMLYTDGLTEARKGNQLLGTSRIQNQFAHACQTENKLQAIAANILTATQGYSIDDDLTLLILRKSKLH